MRIRFDSWQTERERAEVLPNGLRVLREGAPRPRAHVWFPKALKPVWHYTFRTLELREAHIATTIANYDAAQARKAAAKAARTLGDLSQCDPGAVFSYSWGYDQTNVEYFQVVKRSGSLVTLREIATSQVPNSEGFMSEWVVPVKDAFLPTPCATCGQTPFYIAHSLGEIEHDPTAHEYVPGEPKTITKRVQFWEGIPRLSFDHGNGSLVQMLSFGNAPALAARSHYRSHYA